RIGINAPRTTRIQRSEIVDAVSTENAAAIDAGADATAAILDALTQRRSAEDCATARSGSGRGDERRIDRRVTDERYRLSVAGDHGDHPRGLLGGGAARWLHEDDVELSAGGYGHGNVQEPGYDLAAFQSAPSCVDR